MLIIDRFEENVAVVEDTDKSRHIKIKKALLPAEAKESDIIVIENGKYIIDIDKTAMKRAENIKLLRKLGL